MPKTHRLKTWVPYYQECLEEEKRFEFRINDRDYYWGDFLNLIEWDQSVSRETGREQLYKVTYITQGGHFGIPEGYCIMGISKVK